jgi:hypothetical protein
MAPANLFVFVDLHRTWRKVKVTDSRTATDLAACMQELVDVHFPKAERIRHASERSSVSLGRAGSAIRLSIPSSRCRHASPALRTFVESKTRGSGRQFVADHDHSGLYIE